MIQQLRASFAELRRRRVFRVAGVYAAVAFVVWQAADIAFPALRLPDWTMTLVVVLALLGFPIALVFAWIFDVSADGVRVTDAPAGTPPVAPAWTGQRIAAVGGVAVLALAAVAFATLGSRNALTSAERSIAVLPFANLSADAENEYFSDGITEDILGRLARVEHFTVISRTSVLGYRNTTRSVKEIAGELGVAHVLEGSVRRLGSRIRITVNLVDARRDRSLWTETYDRELSDVFAIQSEIAEQIADALRVRLSEGERGRLADGGTSDVEAYELYLQGRQKLRDVRHTGWETALPAFAEALSLYRNALARDPDYALAYVGLSEAYLNHPQLRRELQRDSAELYARRAVQLAPELPDAHVALAMVHEDRQDADAAAVALRRAYALDANNPATLLGLAELEAYRFELANALEYALRAVTVAPGDAESMHQVSRLYFNMGDLDRAEEWSRRSLAAASAMPWQLDCDAAFYAALRGDSVRAAEANARLLAMSGNAAFPMGCASVVEIARGDLAAVAAHAERYLASIGDGEGLRGERAFMMLLLGYAALQRGERARALPLLAEAERLGRIERDACPTTTCRNAPLAAATALQGRTDEAISLLEDAIRVGWTNDYPFANLPLIRMYAPLYGDARYQRMMRQLRERFDAEREKARRAGM